MQELTAEARIAGAARRFELPALLRVLGRRGYGPEAIVFEGIRGDVEAPGLIDSLRFEDAPRRVVVRLNTGLLAPDGPLPSYFHRFAATAADPRPFLAFIRFFDHTLAGSRSYVAHPSDGVARGSPLGRAYQLMAGAGAPPRLHALFRALVPELPVEVAAATFTRAEPTGGTRMGSAGLDGTAILGPVHTTRTRGLVVRLHAEDERYDRTRTWSAVIRERCRRAAALLARSRRPVEVRLRIASYGGAARLCAMAQLGVEPLGAGPADAGGGSPWEIAVLSTAPGGER